MSRNRLRLVRRRVLRHLIWSTLFDEAFLRALRVNTVVYPPMVNYVKLPSELINCFFSHCYIMWFENSVRKKDKVKSTESLVVVNLECDGGYLRSLTLFRVHTRLIR